MLRIIAMLICLAMFAVAFLGCGHLKKPFKNNQVNGLISITGR